MNNEKAEIEIWKPIPGYPQYEVSNMGRVKRLPGYQNSGRGPAYHKGGILVPRPRKAGYLGVGLFYKNKGKYYQIHRLVAMAFIPNPNNYPHVNHKDENPANNRADNLEWCTPKYNNNYGTKRARLSISHTDNPKQLKPVIQFTIDGALVKEYPSIKEAARVTGLCKNGISSCCNGRSTNCGGFQWRFSGSNYELLPKEKITHIHKIFKEDSHE